MTIENKSGCWVQAVDLRYPSLKDNTADADRLIEALKKQLDTDKVEIDFCLLRRLPDLLRNWKYRLRCILSKNRKGWILTSITKLQDADSIGGVAVDLGTSRVVLRLVDLLTGRILAESSFDNPQISIGPDILSRIHFADMDGGLEKLNSLIIDGLNKNIALLCNSCKLKLANIHLISVAGNTAMTHLFLKLNPHWLIREPYIPVVNRPGFVKAKELGITVNSQAMVFVFPNIGSYFGGDLIAGILFSGLNEAEDTSVLVDVGTNAEVVLGNRNWLIACAGAAGPALEGGVTRMGMMAGPGVIDKVSIDPATYNFNIHTIDNMPPKGICGSGLIDLAAQLFLAGLMDIRGKLISSRCGGRIFKKDGIDHLLVVSAKESADKTDLAISQADIDSLIRSKAAMYTILETITSSVGMLLNDLSTFYVAGTFGSFINPRSAISIGMMPDLPTETYKTLGNSSLGGATMAIRSSKCMDDIDKIREHITYLELNVNQDFMNRFSAAKFLPHTNLSLFPSVKTIRAVTSQ